MNAADGFFVDSNVLLYYVDPANKEKAEASARWLDALWRAGTGRLSWQVLHEFYWNAVRKLRMEPASARGVVEDLGRWRPVEATLGLVQDAWKWMDESQLLYWDALIVAAARRAGARYLLSEDFQAGRRYQDIEVLKPFRRSPADFSL
jgi:predicted nucleic acid-binding protein